MAWSHDFCLTCDNLTTDGAYCSEHCRLVDFQKGQIQSSSRSQDSVDAPQHTRFAASRSSSPSLSSQLPSTGTSTDGTHWVGSSTQDYFSTGGLSPALRQSISLSATLPNAPFHPINMGRSRRASAPLLQDTEFEQTTHEPSSYSSSDVTADSHGFSPASRSNPPSPRTTAYAAVTPLGAISEAARRELRRYDDALDSARNTRRRRQVTLA